MKRKFALLLLTLALALVAAIPGMARPVYCDCFECSQASPGAVCTLSWNNQVVYCDDYEWYYCQL